MKKNISLAFSLAFSILTACQHSAQRMAQSVDSKWPDNFLWLEEVESPAALEFAKKNNDVTFSKLKGDSRYELIETEARKIALAKDRLPVVRFEGGMLFNFWQDETNVRGLWRRTTIESYKAKAPDWETVLDLDLLSKEENENWVWKGATCLPPKNEKCLLFLSRGGKDAKVVREFDVKSKKFVADGFVTKEAKSRVSWINENEIFIGTDFGAGSLTDSGYPRLAKRWLRGTDLSQAKEVFSGEKSDVSIEAFVSYYPQKSLEFVSRSISRYEEEIFWLDLAGEKHKVAMPRSANFQGAWNGFLLFLLREPLPLKNRQVLAGSLVALPSSEVRSSNASEKLEVIFEPTKTNFFVNLERSKSALLVEVLDNVQGKVLQVKFQNGKWIQTPLKSPGVGVMEVATSEVSHDDYLLGYSDFLTPQTMYAGKISEKNGSTIKIDKLKSAPARFFSGDLISRQYFVKSKDGTKVPYFLVHKKNIKLNGKNPTLLYGYGGFEINETPGYMASIGKNWLERGGVFALANIRGGGEFGPEWHKAALKEKRQNAFDDFIAVAEDLTARRVTSSRHLGIQGGSNGGLLVGAVFTQRPELFNAVLCEVPLLDMFRYNLLLAGASWMGEYGDPSDPKMRDAFSQYSPYQNLVPGKKYPEVFFLTSTKDDRVHPGHARKMVAKMQSFGYPVLYYENTEGGHGGAANINQRIVWHSLEMTYLWQKLGEGRDSN